MLTGLFQVSRVVSNLERSLVFYRELLGMTIASDAMAPPGPAQANPYLDKFFNKDGVRMKYLSLRSGALYAPSCLELTCWENPSSATMPKFGPWDVGFHWLQLRVDNVEALYKKLSAAGVRFLGPPVVADRWKAVMCFDPDGYGIELLQSPLEPAV